MNKKLSAVKELWLELLYPRKCVACGEAMAMKSYRGLVNNIIYDGLCESCRSKVGYVEEPVCLKCGKQTDSFEEEYCPDCRSVSHVYDRGAAVFHYDDMIKRSIYRFKYKGYRIYGEFYGTEMARRYAPLIALWRPETIIPVPIHRSRERKRGYNQAELIAARLSELTGIPMDKYILSRSVSTKPQKELNRALRKKNVEKAFKVEKSVVEYKRVMLVDDIYTTGSTIDACAGVLKKAGVKEVYFIAICIGAGI